MCLHSFRVLPNCLALVLLTAVAVGCSGVSKIRVVVPGLSRVQLSESESVAVVSSPPPGRPGEPSSDFAAALEAGLVSNGVRIVARENLDAVIEELRLGRGNLFDPNLAARLGRFIQAQKIVVVRTDLHGLEIMKSHAVRYESGETAKSYVAHAVLNAQVIDVETARVDAGVVTRRVTKSGHWFGFRDLIPWVAPSPAELLAVVRSETIRETIEKLVPGPRRVSLKLWNSSPELIAGNRAARTGDWSRAAIEYARGLESGSDRRSRRATYNLSVAKAVLEQLDESEKLIQSIAIDTDDDLIDAVMDLITERRSIATKKHVED